AVEEHAEHSRLGDAAPLHFADEAFNGRGIQVADNLRQVELRGETVVDDVIHLAGRIAVWIRPAAKRQARLARANLLAQLPRVLDASCAADALVSSQNDERGETVLPRLLRVRQAEVERVLGRKERDDVIPFLTSKHSLDFCLSYAEQAWQ